MVAAVVVLAGGSGTRVGADVNKVYLPLAGLRLVSWSLRWASQVPRVGHLVLVVRAQDAELAEQVLAREAAGLEVALVVGGSTRHGSEDAALAHLAPRVDSGEVDVISIHDGARPLAGPALFRAVIDTATAVGGALPALPALDLLPVGQVPAAQVPVARPPRAAPTTPTTRTPPTAPTAPRLFRVQTPQAFRAADLIAAYGAARQDGYEGTDTASSVETYSALVVRAVQGSPTNLKITHPQDLPLAERLLAEQHYRLP